MPGKLDKTEVAESTSIVPETFTAPSLWASEAHQDGQASLNRLQAFQLENKLSRIQQFYMDSVLIRG